MRTECQIIIFHFLLLIYHKSPAIAKALPSSVFSPYLHFPISIAIVTQFSTVIVGDDIHKEDRGDMMMVVLNS